MNSLVHLEGKAGVEVCGGACVVYVRTARGRGGWSSPQWEGNRRGITGEGPGSVCMGPCGYSRGFGFYSLCGKKSHKDSEMWFDLYFEMLSLAALRRL